MRQTLRAILPFVLPSVVFLISLPARAASPDVDPQSDVLGIVREMADADQVHAEEIFAAADAAIYFPSQRQIRWLAPGSGRGGSDATTSAAVKTVREFL